MAEAEGTTTRKILNEIDIQMFINHLSLNLNFYRFDYLSAFPMAFTDLGRTNRVNDALQSLEGVAGYRKAFKDLLKPIQKKGAKRKVNICSFDEQAFKLMKDDTPQTRVICGDDAQNEPEASALEFKPTEPRHVEDKQVVENETIDLYDEKLKEAIEHLNSFVENKNLDSLKEVLKKSRDEGELEIGLGIHLIAKLAGNAFTSQKKCLRCCPCGCQEKVPGHDYMWIGSENTWYGEMDIVAGNPMSGDSVSVTVKNDEVNFGTEILKSGLVDSEDEESEEENSEEKTREQKGESPGERTNDEVKYSGLLQGLNQIIAQAVVFAFTEYNRHKSKGRCIPSVLIDKAGFQYIIYCPLDDILLVSNYISFISEDSFTAKTGYRPFVLLWIILNHRLFFAKCPHFLRKLLPVLKSGFHDKMEGLQHFQGLTEYSKHISVKQNLHFPNDTPNIIDETGLGWFLFQKE